LTIPLLFPATRRGRLRRGKKKRRESHGVVFFRDQGRKRRRARDGGGKGGRKGGGKTPLPPKPLHIAASPTKEKRAKESCQLVQGKKSKPAPSTMTLFAMKKKGSKDRLCHRPMQKGGMKGGEKREVGRHFYLPLASSDPAAKRRTLKGRHN